MQNNDAIDDRPTLRRAAGTEDALGGMVVVAAAAAAAAAVVVVRELCMHVKRDSLIMVSARSEISTHQPRHS
jgi:hypothetical protein